MYLWAVEISLESAVNKKKIINDPVYGFITIPSDFIFDVIQHPYFQRLRYIKQLSMTHLVYPGALHTRFQHALGAMHLMGLALDTLIGKGVEITPEEKEAAQLAVLLHDIGHGPFSHSLEGTLVEKVSHEWLSSLIIRELNDFFDGRLLLCLAIFNDQYKKKFLHQLVSSQLDTDRMDYLSRDSFFTGVSEGVISFDRIITMLNVIDHALVVEQKGIYSVEKFLIARRLMYWQVYLHKTVIAAEGMLFRILKRAKELYQNDEKFNISPSLEHFLRNKITCENFEGDYRHLMHFVNLDDVDILHAIKVWAIHPDPVLKGLCSRMLSRRLYHTEMYKNKPDEKFLTRLEEIAVTNLSISKEDADYYYWGQWVENSAYEQKGNEINILMKDGSVQGIAKASDLSNLETLSQLVRKYAVCYPKELLKELKKENL